MQNFLHNRPHVAAAPGRSVPATPSSGEPKPTGLDLLDASLLSSLHGPQNHDVSVEAIKEGERVVKLIVTCRCGERIEILCAYGPGGR